MNQEHLRSLATAAIENATALGKEAALLGSHGHYARAYFLAVASIEETGNNTRWGQVHLSNIVK